jgi:hypothetical protein
MMALMLIADAAYGQQPPDPNPSSDNYFNTAYGNDALLSLTPSATFGDENTASGFQALYSNTNGFSNTALGFQALYSNQGSVSSDAHGSYNAALGSQALYSNTTGYENTASGYDALYSNTSGYGNSAFGAGALRSNTTANYNTAFGYYALTLNTTGAFNAASGFQSLKFNTTGKNNTASGYEALTNNTTGYDNTASGFEALFNNESAYNNTASGYQALYHNTTGHDNAATGYQALWGNKIGENNTASGDETLYHNNGNLNIALGYQAGYNLTTGSNNIDIGNQGVSGESGVIRIGTSLPTALQTETFIAGIYGSSVSSGTPVMVNSSGQLGTVVSSERFKTDIAPMASSTAKLGQLRPVKFKLKTDAEGTVQYGLVAEEVAKVYPELVIRGQNGRIDGVRYDELAPMLLNEMQHQRAQMTQKIDSQTARIALLEQQLAGIQAALVKLQSKIQLVAQR